MARNLRAHRKTFALEPFPRGNCSGPVRRTGAEGNSLISSFPNDRSRINLWKNRNIQPWPFLGPLTQIKLFFMWTAPGLDAAGCTREFPTQFPPGFKTFHHGRRTLFYDLANDPKTCRYNFPRSLRGHRSICYLAKSFIIVRKSSNCLVNFVYIMGHRDGDFYIRHSRMESKRSLRNSRRRGRESLSFWSSVFLKIPRRQDSKYFYLYCSFWSRWFWLLVALFGVLIWNRYNF